MNLVKIILARYEFGQIVFLTKIIAKFNRIILKFQTETDVLIQVMGSFVLTGLLPIVPFSIVNNLQDIFEIFSRLAAFCLNKSGAYDVYT